MLAPAASATAGPAGPADIAAHVVDHGRHRHRHRHRAALLLPAAVMLAASLAACTNPGVSPPAAPIEAGESSCQLPKASANPAQVKAGESVRITGEWFVVGCGGADGTKPMTLMGMSFIDGAGNAKGLRAVDATGPTGKIDVTVDIPADAPEGMSRVVIGRSGPIRFSVYR